jgi:hypothetical protein
MTRSSGSLTKLHQRDSSVGPVTTPPLPSLSASTASTAGHAGGGPAGPPIRSAFPP